MKRSQGVTAVGVICLVLGVLSLVEVPRQISVLLSSGQLVSRIQMLADLALAVVLLVVGVGILRLTSWALRLLLVYACAEMITAAVGLVIRVPILWGFAASGGLGAKAGATAGMVGMLIGGFLWPVILLVFRSSKGVREQFMSNGAGSHVA